MNIQACLLNTEKKSSLHEWEVPNALLPMWMETFVSIQHFVHLPLNITKGS